jgi:predicted DCC family thiol-disulfide oxidoreductase YuxK
MTHSLILFDAECALCWKSVAFILKIDRAERFLFASLRGKTAMEYSELYKENSLVLVEDFRLNNKRIWLRGRAVFRILWLVGGKWRWLGWLCFLPIGVDLCYRLIARHRHLGGLLNSSQSQEIVKKYSDRFLP